MSFSWLPAERWVAMGPGEPPFQIWSATTKKTLCLPTVDQLKGKLGKGPQECSVVLRLIYAKGSISWAYSGPEFLRAFKFTKITLLCMFHWCHLAWVVGSITLTRGAFTDYFPVPSNRSWQSRKQRYQGINVNKSCDVYPRLCLDWVGTAQDIWVPKTGHLMAKI